MKEESKNEIILFQNANGNIRIDEDSVFGKFRQTAEDGKNYGTNYYNLDVLISIGYRVMILLCIVILFSPTYSFCQNETTLNNKTYRSWITFNHKNTVAEGVIQKVNDSSIQILKISHFPIQNRKDDFKTISSGSIETIKVRRKGSIGKGILIGGLTGAIIGALVSISYANNSNKSPGVYVYPIMITGCGVGLGAMFGSIKIKISINGNQNNFNYNKQELAKYAKYKY